MKKMRLIFFVLMIIIGTLRASGLKIEEYGLKLGLNNSTFPIINGFEDRIPNAQNNFSVGLFYSIKLDKNVFFQNEIYYNTKGSLLKYNNNDYDYTVNYIDTMHLIKIEFPINKTFIPAFLSGFFYSFNIDGELKTNIDGVEYKITEINNNIFGSEYGLLLSLNLKIKFKKFSIILDVRYQKGFSRVFTDYIADVKYSGFYETVPGYKDINIKNKSILLLLGISF